MDMNCVNLHHIQRRFSLIIMKNFIAKLIQKTGYEISRLPEKSSHPANEYFHTLTKRNIHVHFFARHLFFVNNFLPGGEANQYLPAVARMGSRDINGLFHKIGPQIKLSDKEDTLGLQFLNNLGLTRLYPISKFIACRGEKLIFSRVNR